MKVTTLGPPPWSDDELRDAYFSDFQNAYRAIEEHAGADVERTLKEIRFSADLFIDLADDLIGIIKGFKAAAADPLFWSRARRADFNHFERQIRKALFGATSAALALVDHARRSSGKFHIDGYKAKLQEIFDAEQHRFIQNLRNFASHVSVLMPEWEQRYENRRKFTKLLRSRCYSPGSRCWKLHRAVSSTFLLERVGTELRPAKRCSGIRAFARISAKTRWVSAR